MDYRVIILSLLISGCGYVDKIKPTEEVNNNAEMLALYNERLAEAKSWDDGWPVKDDCDGLVWAGVACMAGLDVNLELAFDGGRPYRTPAKTCFEEGRSRSSISNDGMVAAIGCLKVAKLKEMARYGENNNWVYGDPWPDGLGEVYLKPWFQGLLGRATGENKSYSKIPLTLVYSPEDYPAHIQTLAMIKQEQLTGGLSSENIALLKKYHERDPGDYLIRSVYARYNRGVTEPFTDVLPPSYVRGTGVRRLALAHWLLAAKIYLSL